MNVMDWIVYQFGRVLWAFDHDGGAWVQGVAAIVTSVVTVVLGGITYFSLKASREAVAAAVKQAQESERQTAESKNQLRMMAHPNIQVDITFDTIGIERRILIHIKNHGAYPFRLSNVGVEIEHPDISNELNIPQGWSPTISSNSFVPLALKIAPLPDIDEIDSDCILLEFDCEDILGLSKKRYAYRNSVGLSEVSPVGENTANALI
jgi:hypothetical protein